MILQAIITKYLGPTNYRGSRIVAKASAGRVTVSYDHSLGIEENHRHAAETLARKYDWLDGWKLEQGGLEDGYAFVIVRA